MPASVRHFFRMLRVAACLLALVAAGCQRVPEPSAHTPDQEGAPMATPTPAPADVPAQLMAADRAFAAAVAAATGTDRAAVWADWFAPDGRQLLPGAVVTGHEDIQGLMTSSFADPEATLTWEPDLADGAGDWGWTSGRYVSRRPGPDEPIVKGGRYLTVWRRDDRGAWKVAVDTGVPDGS